MKVKSNSISLENLIVFSLGGDWGKQTKALTLPGYKNAKVIRGTDFTTWNISRAKNATLRMVKIKSLEKRSLNIGDLVVEISGGGPDQPVGRVIIIDDEAIANEPDPLICSNFFRQIRLSNFVNPKYVYYFLDSQYYFKRLDKIQTQTTNLRNLNFKKYLSSLFVPLISLDSQEIIVNKITALNEKINAARRKLRNVSTFGESLLQKYLPESASKIPLRGYIEESTIRIGKQWRGILKIGVDNQKGITPLRIGTKKTFETYKIVTPGSFVYNPMRINVGSIALYQANEIAITSPDYVVFKVRHTLSSRLLLNYLKSSRGLAEINKNTRGSVRSRLYFESLEKVQCPIINSVEVQREAEKSLAAFEKLNQKRLSMEDRLRKTFYNFLEKLFQKAQKNKPFKNYKLYLDKIHQEREAYQLKMKAMKKTESSQNQLFSISSDSIKGLIGRTFKNKPFQFSQLLEAANNELDFEYDEFKDVLFDLLRDPLRKNDEKPFLRQLYDEKKSTNLLIINS